MSTFAATHALAAACAFAAALLSAPALAKLPPLSDAAKAQAAETAHKAAWTAKLDAFKLCEAQDEAVAHYHATLQQRGETAPAGQPTPACTNPGSYTPPLPLEASGAHSPAETATAPPSTNATKAQLDGTVKK